MPWFKSKPTVRTGQGSTQLSKEEFLRRWKQRFYDPAFEPVQSKIDELGNIAWEAYDDHRKSPRTRKAGAEFADPEYELAIEWLETRAKIQAARDRHRPTATRARILLFCASPRPDETCPGEMSKKFRLAQGAGKAIAAD